MSNPYQPPNEYPSPPRRRIWPFLLVGCAVVGGVIIAACAGVIYFGFRQVTGQGEVALEVDRLFEEIAQGRAAEFYRDRGSAELKRVTNEKAFVDFAETVNQRLGKLQSKTASGFSVRTFNLTTYVDATFECQFERGKAIVKTSFEHEGEQWLPRSFHVDSPELLKAKVRKKCPNCGGLYDSGAKFCPHCGAQLGGDNAPEKGATKADDESQQP